jgi:hypothetical protein
MCPVEGGHLVGVEWPWEFRKKEKGEKEKKKGYPVRAGAVVEAVESSGTSGPEEKRRKKRCRVAGERRRISVRRMPAEVFCGKAMQRSEFGMKKQTYEYND